MTVGKLITASHWNSEVNGTFFLACVGGNIIAGFVTKMVLVVRQLEAGAD